MPITFILVDDHVLFRQGLALLIHRHYDWEIVGEAGDGLEAERLAALLRPRIALLDVEMPGMNGIEAARRILEASPGTRVVALSMYGDPHYLKSMFQAGALAYVLKNEAIDDLVQAIEAVLRGETFVSPAVLANGSAATTRSAAIDLGMLSPREIDVLRLLAEGKRNKEIASALGVSVKTVETHRSRILFKLEIDSLPEMVKFAINAGITTTRS